MRNGQEKEIKVKFDNSNEKILGITSKLEITASLLWSICLNFSMFIVVFLISKFKIVISSNLILLNVITKKLSYQL